MRNKIILILSITTLILGTLAMLWSAKEQRMTFIALDNENKAELPKNFRVLSSEHILGVHASASGQISERSLIATISYIKQHPEIPKIWIIDLRQESHGFINGFPVTWYEHRNAANNGKSNTEIITDERKLLKKIKLGKPIDLFSLIKESDGQVSKGKKHTLIAERVETEEQLITRHNLAYFRLFTLDHNKPDNDDVDRFIEFVRTQVQPHDWLHFHCRGGRGRTSTYLTLLFIMFNASKMSLEDILVYQQAIGSIDLAKMYSEERKLWKNNLANFRYEFIKDFYRFAQDPRGLGFQKWSAWLAQQSAEKP